MMGVPLTGNWSKSSVAPIFDHSWKISYPGVAQLVACLLGSKMPRVAGARHQFLQSIGLEFAGVLLDKDVS